MKFALTARLFLATWAAGLTAFGQPGLLQAPLEKFPANPPRLSPLLVNAAGREIKSRSAWRKQRAALRRQWLEVLGTLPARRPPVHAEVLASEDLPEFTREHVRYYVERDVFTDGYLLTPRGAPGRRPAIVVFHPTTPIHAKGVAGLDPAYDPEKWQGVHLAQRGYVVWCPRNYINADGADWVGNARRVLAAHPDWTGMTRMVWDAMRAVDFLETLPTVDRKRIGCLGHSLGGKQALYAAAFDERIRAAVCSEGGIGLRFSNWDALWYFGPRIRQPEFNLENHQVLALVAPRALLLLAGDAADGDRSWPFLEAAWPVYELLGAREQLGWFNHHRGHRYPPEARHVAEAFLDRHLRKRLTRGDRADQVAQPMRARPAGQRFPTSELPDESGVPKKSPGIAVAVHPRIALEFTGATARLKAAYDDPPLATPRCP